MSFTEWMYILMGIFFIIANTILITKNIKDERNSAPNGKTFVKKFYEKLTDIEKALQIAKVPSFDTNIKGYSFKVSVKKDDTPKGLEYETIPVYKSYCVYINNEAVCRAHILHINCKDKIYIEFSSTRKYAEVIDIVNNVHNQAKEILTENNKKYFNTDKDSFFYNKSSEGN